MNAEFDYYELNKLNTFFLKHRFQYNIYKSEFLGDKSYYPKMNFSLRGQKFDLYVDDEYDDLMKNHPLLTLCLVLRELEGYEYTKDYSIWCQERFLDSENLQVKKNFDNLKKVYKQVTKLVGKIDSYVSDFDFELNSGAAQKLRNL